MPLRFGLPSAVRGARYARVCAMAGQAVNEMAAITPTATVDARPSQSRMAAVCGPGILNAHPGGASSGLHGGGAIPGQRGFVQNISTPERLEETRGGDEDDRADQQADESERGRPAKQPEEDHEAAHRRSSAEQQRPEHVIDQ